MGQKIYKLVHPELGIVYVGRTTMTLKERKSRGYKGNPEVQAIYKECAIELLEETDDVSREDFWIEKLLSEGHNLLNKRRGTTGLTHAEFMKIYNEANREAIRAQKKVYKEANREKILQRQKAYYQRNKEEIKRKNLERYHKNKNQK